MDAELSAQFSPWKFEHYFYEQYLAVPRASVFIAFGGISHIFNVTVDSDFPAQFALFFWTLFLLAVIWRWDGVFGGSDVFFFSRSSGLSRSCAPVLGALDGEEFFAIEGSPCQLAQDLLT